VVKRGLPIPVPIFPSEEIQGFVQLPDSLRSLDQVAEYNPACETARDVTIGKLQARLMLMSVADATATILNRCTRVAVSH
jgi:hypothetical protein